MTENLYWGISAGSHDAALSVIYNNRILFASHAERFSRVKNDPWLNRELLDYAFRYGFPEKIFFYERQWWKRTRQLYAGQYKSLLKPTIKSHINSFSGFLSGIPVKEVSHHKSHAAAGYFTSKFDSAAVVVIDAIGEWETLSIWKARGNKLKKLYSVSYPNSLGLWYSAMTQRVNLKPNEEEYIFMGMSAFGDSRRYYRKISRDFFNDSKKLVSLRRNLHRGCKNWAQHISEDFDLAASSQAIFEHYLIKIMRKAKKLTGENNLVYVGGCALNCAANSLLPKIFDDIWIVPNPGDAGSSIGAVAAGLNTRIDWQGPYLGYEIRGQYPVAKTLEHLLTGEVVGVAAGKAEFGPRALGNRSLLADPRSTEMKDKVNAIKRRQQFRPFAPVILEDYADDYFDMPVKKSPYMQYVARCKQPQNFPAIIHIDGTSRVQTVNRIEHPDLYRLIDLWRIETGCPMLLNTSLNIRGEPLVNNEEDADNFSVTYNVPVCIAENAYLA